MKALCVAPFGMEEGTEADMPGQEFGLRDRRGGRVPLPRARRVRREDTAGTVVEEWEGQIDELAPVRTTLEGARRARGRWCRSTCTAR